MIKYVLSLYITGTTGRSIRAISNLKNIVNTYLRDKAEVEIIDVLENPEAAINNRIIATPTLILIVPPPPRRIIGDLSDTEAVLSGIGIVPIPIERD